MLRSNNDFSGVYILENTANGKTYVGQSQNVLVRILQHIRGKGSPDVYFDFRSGDLFTAHLIPLEGSSYTNLNDMERDMIEKYKAYENGYNRTHGNST